MATFKPSKVAPYSPGRPYPVPMRSRAEEDSDDEPNRRRKELGSPLSQCCTCPCALLGGSLLLLLFAAAIAVPLVIALETAASSTEMATSSSTIVLLSTTTSTTSSTTTQTTTAIPCIPSCTAQTICVLGRCVGIGYLSFTLMWSRKGDGDIVVGTPNAKIIYFNNTGASLLTDQGKLDIDDRNGTGPENVFWSNGGPTPPVGVYYVCFEPYLFSPNITSPDPISITVNAKGSNNSISTVVRNFTSNISNGYDCRASSPNLLLSYTYP